MIEHYLRCSKCKVFFEIHKINYLVISYVDMDESEPIELYFCNKCRSEVKI